MARNSFDRPGIDRRSLLKGAVAGAAALTSLGAAACTPGQLGGPSNKKLTKAPTASGEPSGEVTIWDRQGDLFKVFDAALGAFRKKYPKVTVHHVAVDVDAKLPNTLITGTNVPDGSFWEDVNIQGSAAHLTDLSDLLAPYKDQTIAYKLDVNTIGGRTVGVPWDLDPGLLYYRADILDKAGVDPATLTTYDALTEAARKIKSKNPKAKPIHIEGDPATSQLQLEMYANQQHTSMVNAKGQLQLQSEAYRQILSWQQQVVKEGLGAPTKYLQPADIATLEDGTQSLVPFAIWFDYAPQMLLKKTKGLWRAALLPAWSDGGARSGVMGGSSFVIPAKAKNPELAWLVFEFLVYKKPGYTAVYGPNSTYPNGLNTSLPSYKPALDPNTPLFKPVPELGNEDIWKVFTDAANQVPGGYKLSPWFNQATKYLGNNLQKLLAGKMTVDQVLSTSSDQITKNLINR